MKPRRIQLSRKKGFKLPPNTVVVTRGRSRKWGNPFRVGGRFMIGDPDPTARFRMSWCESRRDSEDDRFTLIADRKTAVEFFKRLVAVGYYKPEELEALRGKNLACFCPVGEPCHADVLLEIANA